MTKQAVITTTEKVRIDIWLWAARFYRTRQLAQQAVVGGKVHYNGARVKPSHSVQVGAVIKARLGYVAKEVVVLGLSKKRGNAETAQTLYEETTASMTAREQQYRERQGMPKPITPKRPDKRTQNLIRRFVRKKPG